MPAFMKLGDIKGEAVALNPNGPPTADFTTLAGANLLQCSPVDPLQLCSSLVFQTVSLPSVDSVTFNFIDSVTGATSSSTSFFANGSFDGYGSFTSLDGNTTLTISAVPETGVWLALILGFGVIGTMLRRKRALAISAP